MQTYQYYIDDIQSAVFSPETADLEFLRDSAAQYAEACAEINDRLRQVGQLLQRGLRSEAIQLAEEEPNLLDVFAMLDFPELPTWCEMLREWEMSSPPRLLVDIATDVNQAYADLQPLDSLLKQHRLLALGRAPLSARIRTLRRIIETDPGSNGTWEEELTSLEKARLNQVGKEAEQAHRNRDLQLLEELVGELKDDSWHIEKPASLQQRVIKLNEDLASHLAREELERLEVELNTAHMAFDEPLGFKLREHWNEAVPIADLQPEDPLSQRAAPALDWIEGQALAHAATKNRDSAVAALTRALEDGSPARELEQLYQSTLAFEEPIPESLRHRVEQKLAADALVAKRRHRTILAGVVGSLVVVGALVVFVIIQQTQRAAVATAAGAMQSLVSEGHLEEAQQYYDQLAESSDQVASSLEVQEQKSLLDNARQEETDRLASFERAIDRAEQSPTNEVDQIALSEARQLARTPSEKGRVAEVDSRIAAVRRQVQKEQNDAIRKQLATFRDRLTSLEAAGSGAKQGPTTDLQQLRRDIQRLKQKYPRASSAVIAQLDPIAIRISAILQSHQSHRDQTRALDRITNAVGDVAGYRDVLQAYASEFPESSISSNIDRLTKESHLWEGLLAWNEFLHSFFGSNVSLSTQHAKEAIKRGDELAVLHGDIPLAKLYDARKAYLESVGNRVQENGDSLAEDLRKLFRDPLVIQLWMVERRDGSRFYSRKQPDLRGSTVHINYITGFDLDEKQATVRNSDVTYNDRAPQTALAEGIRSQLKNSLSKNWEGTFTKISKNIADNKRLDPILKVVLLQRVLETASNGSTVFDSAFRKYRQAISDANIDLSVAWMNPQDDIANGERRRADVLFGSLPPISEFIQKTADLYRGIRKSPQSKYHWVGWLRRGTEGDWQVRGGQSSAPTGKLVVIRPGTDKTVAQIHPVGISKKSNMALTVSSPTLLVEGRPVFIEN